MVTLLLVLGGCDRRHEAPEPPPQVERPAPEALSRGGKLFYADTIDAMPGCVACHDAEAERARVGPSLEGLSERASEDYVRQSIVDPGAHVVPGFPDIMPREYGDQLSDEDVDALVDFLLSEH